VSRRSTTISCRAFALSVVLLACAAVSSAGADKIPPPRLPLAVYWSIDLHGAVTAAPVPDGDRVFVALKTGQIAALAVKDGHELWRVSKDITVAMAADSGLLFVAAGEAVEALRGADGRNAWTVPRLKTVAPLVASGGWVIAVTEAEIVAIRAKDGEVAWRHAAGGVRLPPAIDGEYLYAGALDGRVLALTLASGAVAWEYYVPEGVSTMAARAGRVYVGGGDKYFYCLSGRSGKGKEEWQRSIGARLIGRIAVDDDRVYLSALSNVIFALDRSNGNQRWTTDVRRRPIDGVLIAGHIVFVPAVASQLSMYYDHDGRSSGAIALPSDMAREAPTAVSETAAGVTVFVVTGGLANEWMLTYIAPVDDASIAPFTGLTEMPGVPFLTDPILQPIGQVLGPLVLGDPVLWPASEMGWPLVLRDPPLEPLTTLPGLQLRPLSPVLPIRREE
jgi:outer membrane protein assembly factor BamB